MKVLVSVKRVMDYTARIRIKADGSGVETAHAKMVMNPFDEIAVEEAIRLKEKKIIEEIVVISIGPSASQETIRTALAMGADRGILIETEELLSPLKVAKILQVMVGRESPRLCILGKQAVDDDHNQTGQMLAGLLNWGQGTFASKVVVDKEVVSVTREIDGGLETLLIQLPAVITTDLRLNEPRYLSLPNIVAAKRKPLTVIPLADLTIFSQSKCVVTQVVEPEKHRAGIKVSSASELVEKLHEAGVIS